MTLCAQKLKMRCARKSDAATVCVKLKAMSGLSCLPIPAPKHQGVRRTGDVEEGLQAFWNLVLHGGEWDLVPLCDTNFSLSKELDGFYSHFEKSWREHFATCISRIKPKQLFNLQPINSRTMKT
jgi:hypothetical protein